MIEVTFYGVRGSTPCSCPGTVGIGGNTSCVLVEAGDEPPIILDCGTGLRYLGQRLLGDAKPFRGTALVTHLHWDHIQGLPFFAPLLSEGSELLVVGPPQLNNSLRGEVNGFLCPPLFPVDLDDLPGEIHFRERSSGRFNLGKVTVTVADVPHVGATNGYRIDFGGASVAYLSDHQQPSDGSMRVPNQVLELCQDVDILIHDAQYDESEFAARSDWGHSTPAYAAEVARRCGARRLVLFHHDPSHDDRWISQAVEETQTLLGSEVQVIAAAEGRSLRSGAPVSV